MFSDTAGFRITSWFFQLALFLIVVVVVVFPLQGLANFLCEGSNSRYFSLCRLHGVSRNDSTLPFSIKQC